MRSVLWKVRTSFHALERHVLVRRPVVDGNPIIAKAILDKVPFAAGKMGSVEAAALKAYLKRKRARKCGSDSVPSFSPYMFHTLFVNSGVFPQHEEMFDRFCAAYIDAIKNCDALAAWDIAGEAQVFRSFCPRTTLLQLRSLEPYFSKNPWSHALVGKRVLVISPFAMSIERQFANRDKVWGSNKILPDFELLSIKAPLSAGLVEPDSKDWFEALDRIKAQMDKLEYDVVLIGAGAFSLPLAAHAKARGKVGIHLGGSLQILFGIVGQRWREHKDFKKFINDNWCSPSSQETPDKFKIIEGGCYW